MPSDDRCRLDHDEGGSPDPEDAVALTESRAFDRAYENTELLTQSEVFSSEPILGGKQDRDEIANKVKHPY